jgi:3-phenylpropionate/trans-cinnamate dioxygenase ferredoxin reductase subunit
MAQTYLIVGAGQAGGRAAETLRAQGYTGHVVLVGDESWRPYERPPLSKDVLLSADDANCYQGWLHNADFYEMPNLERVHDAVERLDTENRIAHLKSGRTIPYAKCLLTTGGRCRPMASLPASPKVVSLRTLDDAMRLRQLLAGAESVAVIGGGFLGLEFAASAVARGVRATVYESAPRLLARALPEAFSERLLAKHRAMGVEILLGAGQTRVTQSGQQVEIDGAGGRRVYDFCVVAVGQLPNEELASASGIEVRNGIVVDEYCRTSAPGVYAAGDCANFPLGLERRATRLESWQNAQDQASVAARNMLGEALPYQPLPWFWTDQHDWNIQMLGLYDGSVEQWVERPAAPDKTLMIGLKGGVIVYALALNQGGELRALKRFVEQRLAVDPEALADMGVKLRKLEPIRH